MTMRDAALFAFPNADLAPGDVVTCPQRSDWGALVVVDASRQSTIRARRADGTELTLGRGAVRRVGGGKGEADGQTLT